MIAPLRRHTLLLLLLAAFLLLAALYSVANPPFEAPDELWHYAYARWYAEGHGLPQPADFGTAAWAQEGSQPPLYYLLAALPAGLAAEGGVATVHFNPHAAPGDGAAFGNRNMVVHDGRDEWPWQGPALGLHLARFLSILLGAVTVLATYGVGRVAAPGWPAAALLAAALVAFNPQFLFINAAVTNDVLVTTLGTLGLWLCAWGVAASPRLSGRRRLGWWLLLGLAAGAAALSKVNGLLLSGLAVATLAYVAARASSWRLFFTSLLVAGGTVLAVAGWWYGRNWLLFGDPLGVAALVSVLPGRAEPAGVAELLTLAPGIWRSLWAVFGWFNITVDEWVHWLYAGLALLAVGGWLAGGALRRPRLRQALNGPVLLLLALWLLALTAALARWAQINFAQGRLLFPALASLAVLLGVGLLAWWPVRRHGVVTLFLTLTLATLAAAMPFVWIRPAYAPPAPLAAGMPVPNPMAVRFEGGIELLGYQLSPMTAQVGDSVEVTLFWRATMPPAENFSVFLHGTDQNDLLQVQRDSYPGQGNLPTRRWTPGAIYPDRHRLLIPPTVLAPAVLRIDVGLYAAATGARLAHPGGEAITLGKLAVTSRPGAVPNPRRVVFDEKLALVGFAVNRTTLAPGEALEVATWWEALQPMDKDYVLFAHLVLPPETVWAQLDQMPQAGAARTSTWQPGARIEDRRVLQLPAEAPPGAYRLAVGFYDKDTYERLPVNFDDRAVVLTQIKVEEPDP